MEDNFEIDLDNYPALETEEFVDDIFAENTTETVLATESNDNNPNNFLNEEVEGNIINMLLEQKGITDPTKIKFENEEGEIEELDFNSLSREEQLVILANENSTPEISDQEIEIINFMRENNVSFEEIIEHEKQKAIEEYITNNINQTYTVDDLSNEELYRFDLQSRYPDLTEEELNVKITQELLQPDLFNKMSESLRIEYKGLEDAQNAELAEQKTQEEEQTYNTLVDTMINIAENTNDLYSLDLEDNDKEEVLSFLLDRDINGQSEFAKLLNNPDELFKLA